MYTKMFQYIKECLVNNGGEEVESGCFPFRKRSEHIKRVFMWAERLVKDIPSVDKEAILVSAIFHDVGYAVSLDNSKHAENSADICEKYLTGNGFTTEFINQVVYLVKNHSNKSLMPVKETPLELIVLMEADLLDETGALSIIWDCMMEGTQEVQTFEKTYHHILRYSFKQLKGNPMVTAKGKEFWKSKQNLMQEFAKHLSFDLGIEDEKTMDFLEAYHG